MARVWRNHTDLDDATCRAIYEAVCPQLPAHDVRISNCARGWRGRAYAKGFGYHASARPFAIVSVGRTDKHCRHFVKELRRKGRGYLYGFAVGSRWEAFGMDALLSVSGLVFEERQP